VEGLERLACAIGRTALTGLVLLSVYNYGRPVPEATSTVHKLLRYDIHMADVLYPMLCVEQSGWSTVTSHVIARS
jgi:hypothetical protein